MNDDLLLSLHLDGRLAPGEAEALRRRLAAEPDLREQLRELERLQELSHGLLHTGADFTPEQLRVRAGSLPRRRPGRGLVAAAALLLALSHGGAYLLGAYRAAPAPSPIARTERVLEEAAGLDAALPFDRLRDRLVRLRGHLQPLPRELAGYDAGRWERRRADELAEALARMEAAFEEVEDPGFLSVVLKEIAADSLEGEGTVHFVPANAVHYGRVVPLRDGRYRVFFVSPRGALSDEGTLEELRARHTGFRFLEERER